MDLGLTGRKAIITGGTRGIGRRTAEVLVFAQAEGWNPMGRMGTPDEVARAIAFFASPAASFITGTNLLVDAGLTRGVQF